MPESFCLFGATEAINFYGIPLSAVCRLLLLNSYQNINKLLRVDGSVVGGALGDGDFRQGAMNNHRATTVMPL